MTAGHARSRCDWMVRNTLLRLIEIIFFEVRTRCEMLRGRYVQVKFRDMDVKARFLPNNQSIRNVPVEDRSSVRTQERSSLKMVRRGVASGFVYMRSTSASWKATSIDILCFSSISFGSMDIWSANGSLRLTLVVMAGSAKRVQTWRPSRPVTSDSQCIGY